MAQLETYHTYHSPVKLEYWKWIKCFDSWTLSVNECESIQRIAWTYLHTPYLWYE